MRANQFCKIIFVLGFFILAALATELSVHAQPQSAEPTYRYLINRSPAPRTTLILPQVKNQVASKTIVPEVKHDDILKDPKADSPKTKSFRDLSMPHDFSNPKSYDALFSEVSKITGVKKKLLYQFAAIESGFDPTAKSVIGARGLFQFTSDTWAFVIRKFGSEYHVTENDIMDVRANALMAGYHLIGLTAHIREVTKKREVLSKDLYLAHLLGRTGYARFHKFHRKTLVANKMPKAAKYNKLFFYNKGKMLTQAEVSLKVKTHIADKILEFGLIA